MRPLLLLRPWRGIRMMSARVFVAVEERKSVTVLRKEREGVSVYCGGSDSLSSTPYGRLS